MIFDMSDKYAQLLATTINFTKREIKNRYAGALFGSIWIVAYPLAFALISALVFSLVFQESVGNIPYFIFVLIGFNSWLWFSQTVIYSTRSLIQNRDLISNNKFPTESIIFSIASARTIDYMVNMIMIYVLMTHFNQHIHLYGFMLMIFISTIQLIFQAGVSLLFSAINVYFRDWQNIVDIVLQLIFYSTPIVYSIAIVPMEFRNIILFNPMTQFVLAYRDALFSNHASSVVLIMLFVISIITFIFGYYMYKKTERTFAEII